MKKQLFTKLLSTVVTGAIVFSYGMFVCADETEKTESDSKSFEIATVEENVVVDSGYDNDEMAEGYIRQKMSLGKEVTYAYDYAGQLDEGTLAAYNYLSPVICEIAAGTQTSTDITIPKESLCFTFTFDELGVTGFSDSNIREKVREHMPVDQDALVDALLFSHPYELYWYDKSAGCSMGYGILGETSSAGDFIKVTNFHFKYSVASEYQDGDRFKVNSTFGTALTAAATSVRNIIRDSAGYDDYNKLLYYNDMICLMTDYNHDAVNNGAAYGNPWQLVWVFDGNDSTKVVCEGYSKAFQYLCDNTAFDSDSIYAICVYGSIPEGGHMWNIVHMEDGKNYLVDVTNSDPGGNGRTGQKYFLKGSSTGSVSSGFTVNGAKFQYYADVTNFYPESALTLAKSDYSYTAPAEYNITVINNVGGTGFVDPTRARAGQTINTALILDDGYEFVGIKVNGEFIEGGSFKMPAKDTTVEFVFKKQDFTVTLLDVQNGTAMLSATTAQMGDTVTVTAIPDTGYELDCIKVDGVAITGNSFEMPYYNVKVEVLFKQSVYRVWVFYAGGGKAYASANTAHYGDTITLTYDYPAGYEITRISVYDEKENYYTVTNDSFTMPATEVVVEVEFDKINYNITFDTVENCNASVKKNTANAFEDVTVTVEPFEGYELDYITVNGNMINGCTFEMPLGDVTINVFCKKTDYRVKLDLLKNCDASLSASTANFGDEITVTVDPVEGYELDYIKVNGTVIDGYTFTMPANDVAVDVVCKKIDYTVKLNLVKNCDALLNTDTANVGDEITVTVDPVEGYELDYIKVNGTVIDGYTFVMPAKDVAVDVVCKKIDYTITMNIIKDCDAAPNTAVANVGDEITINVEPVEGYEFDYLEVNGTKITSKVFVMPAENVIVNVYCKKVNYTVTMGIIKDCDAETNVAGANAGDEITVTVTPVEGYEFDYIEVNGTKYTTTTFQMPAANVTVNVYCRKIDYTITVTAGNGGTAAASVNTANVGDEITITATPETGYEFNYITVNGVKFYAKKFQMPAANAEVEVVFKKIAYKLSFGELVNGTARFSKSPANMGDEITVKLVPDAYAEFDYIRVNGEKINGNTFTMPAGSVVVDVYYVKIQFPITVAETVNGTVELPETAGFDDVITVVTTPDPGYEVDTIKVNGSVIDGDTLVMDAGEMTVEVTFKKSVYNVTLASINNGTATVSATTANYGDEITVTATPADGYTLDTVKVNGEAIDGLTFKMPAEDATVEVTFKKDTFAVTLTYDSKLVTVSGISATGSSKVGTKYEFTVTAADKYEIASVKVNGTEISAAGGKYTVTQPEEDIEIAIEATLVYVPKNGWITEGSSKYYYVDDNAATGWTKIEGSWYYFSTSGVMQTGWVKDGSSWYYLDTSGVMVTGWKQISGKWYYLKSNGVMVTSWQQISGKWYYFENSGAMVTGWKQISSKWYYFENSGAMVSGWKQISGKWYYFESSGAMKTGWFKDGNSWYYLNSNGSMATGWLQLSGKWYYLESSGVMVTGSKKIGSKTYNFDSNGVCLNP